MCNRIKTFLTMLLLFVGITAYAQPQRCSAAVPAHHGPMTAADEINESWWGYFDGDYNSISVIGLGSGAVTPLHYGCAIKIEGGNPDVMGRRIKALKFAFERLNYIEDVSVWVSTTLPATPDDADIFYIPLDVDTLRSIEADDDVNVVPFPEPYQVDGNDLYVGYSFTVTSNEGDLCTYPIVVSYSSTMKNAFLLNWGDGWIDNAGRNYGNLALMLLIDDGGEFVAGDVNYDLSVNVLDVSSVIEYILGGSVSPFNKKAADIDGNGEINIVDVESVIDMALERYEAPTEDNTDASRDAVLTAAGDNTLDVSLMAENQYRGFQMDIVLPRGAELTSLTASAALRSTHGVRYTRVADGRYRVVASSIDGSSLPDGTDKLLSITATTGDIKVEDMVFVTATLHEQRLASRSWSDVTGISDVNVSASSSGVYDIYGVKAGTTTDNLPKGVYIVNGRKVIIK